MNINLNFVRLSVLAPWWQKNNCHQDSKAQKTTKNLFYILLKMNLLTDCVWLLFNP